MVIDAVMYSGEYEALLLRLHELADVVDAFVVVEAPQTFTGAAKPLYFAERDRARLGALSDRILYVTTPLPRTDDPWARETHQRNAMITGLEGLHDDDVVLIGDVDEIPNADAVRGAARLLGGSLQQLGFDQDLCLYFVNNHCTTARWRGTQAVTAAYLAAVTPQGVRDRRNVAPALLNAGWHFGSLLGDEGAARFERKLASFSHAEECAPFATPENVAAAIDAGRDVSGRQDILFRADLTPKAEDYPAWLWEHRHDMAHLFAPGTTL